ncbi:unnamed protein product [Rodentolepis nana]|uniref:B-block_TFIIIC domain-containing protein n=1 Tax=Rodentolepis nana TaxID=102285 RepID=A0A0R3TR27_RODNA|nr:unnamed protein product [Rodentolepis nana]
MSYIEIIINEICAGGLDGVPISHLWQILQEPPVQFPLDIKEKTKEFLWTKIKCFRSFNFYVRKEEPPPYEYKDRFADLEEIVEESHPAVARKLYPVDEPGVYGSCADYNTRTCVNSQIFSEEIPYSEVYRRWGNLLVVVAPQSLRTKFLTGSEVLNNNMNPKLYRVLELIAKSRYNGIPISGQESILSYGESSSTVFYIRKLFSSDGYIKSQPFITHDAKKRAMRRTTLLHSFRFFRPLTYPLALFLEKLSNFLLESKSRMMLPCIVCQKFEMGRRSLMRIVKFGIQQGCLKLIHVSFSTACALISNSGNDCGEICAEMLRKETLELNNLDGSIMTSNESPGRRFVRDATVIYLQHPFDVEKYMKNAHIDHGSRPASLNQPQEDTALALDDTIVPDTDIVDEKEQFSQGSFYSIHMNGEDTFCVQICRFLSDNEAKSNSLLATHFNSSHRAVSRFADALAGIGKLATSKISVGTTFCLVRRFVTEKEAFDIVRSTNNSRGSISFYNQREQRKAFILENLEKFRVFPSVPALRARIWAHEAARGLPGKMDRKSLSRIVADLVKEARLKFIHMQIIGRRHDGTPRPVDLQLVCHPSIETDSPELIDCVLREKKRYMMTPRNYGALKPEEALMQAPEEDEEEENLRTKFPQAVSLDVSITKKEMELIRLSDKNISKLRRRCLLHKFLFYLLYELPPDTQKVPSTPESWAPVYNPDSVEYRYVPPLPPSTVPGWLTLHDILQSMPMGLFLYLSSPNNAPRILLQWLSVLKGGEASLRPVIKKIISSQVEEANAFSPYRDRASLAPDALRRFELLRTPIAYVPVPGGHSGGLYAWIMSRHNMNRVYKLIRELSSHGLVTLNGQTTQGHLPMANIYLHRKAVILDTRFAAPAHHIVTDTSNCPLLKYTFKTPADIDTYWLHLRAILMYTPFGFSRFSDPALANFADLEPPVLSVKSLREVLVQNDESYTPTLPQILPTTLKRPTPSVVNTAIRALVDIYETKVEMFVLKGVGGLHAALYKVKAPFEEMGYGVNEQGLCTQYQPQYPSPTLQMQPAVRDFEMRIILGEFEPGLKTIGDGAFWPWTVQLFFGTNPVKELELPPEHPEGLFISRSRRYPFRITSTVDKDTDEEGTPRKDHRRTRSYRLRSARKKLRRINSDGESADASGSDADNENDDGDQGEGEEEEEGGYSSPFEELQPIIQSRKRRLRKKASTTPHIHRKAISRRFISTDKRALDERDVEIRNSLHSRRACWTKIEDQLLLACRVASLFLVGHTREYVCVPSNIVRNIMHEYFPIESSDKTSYACSRRLKFLLMLRNDERTQTDILLTKVSSDTELMAKYHIGKSAWVHLYNRDSEQAHHFFRDLVQLIVKNFLPTIAKQCPHMLNKSLLIPGISNEENQEMSRENQFNLERIREMLLKSRETLRSHYDFILLASVHSEQALPDIGQSRPAIVIETLRNLFLGALRLRKEINSPHDPLMLNRILKQYPYEEMTAAVKCLATTDALRKQKSFEDFDLNIIGHFRLKTTLRLVSWCNLHLFINIRFFMEAWSLYRQCSEETRRLRGRQRRSKVKATSQASTDASESLQRPRNEWIITKHDFAEPTSGGLVATFTEFLYCKSVKKNKKSGCLLSAHEWELCSK